MAPLPPIRTTLTPITLEKDLETSPDLTSTAPSVPAAGQHHQQPHTCTMFCTPLRHFEPSYYGASDPYYAYTRAPARQSYHHPSASYASHARAVEQARAREAAIAAHAAEQEAAAYHELLARRREQARREAARQEYLREAQRAANYDRDFLARLFGPDYHRDHGREPASRRTTQELELHPVDETAGQEAAANLPNDGSANNQTESEIEAPEASTSALADNTSSPVNAANSTMSIDEAVAVIQKHTKRAILIRQRLRALQKVRAAFEMQQNDFVPPESLDFDEQKSQAQEQPVLAYTPNNRPLQAYEESLLRLLTDLDDVPSGGLEKVKATRKKLAKDIQAELNRVDAFKTEMWNRPKQT